MIHLFLFLSLSSDKVVKVFCVEKFHSEVSGHSKIPKYLPVFQQGFCYPIGESTEILSRDKSHKAGRRGRSVEGLAKGFSYVCCLTLWGLTAAFSEGTRLLLASASSQWSRQWKHEESWITVTRYSGHGWGIPQESRVRAGWDFSMFWSEPRLVWGHYTSIFKSSMRMTCGENWPLSLPWF